MSSSLLKREREGERKRARESATEMSACSLVSWNQMTLVTLKAKAE